jgi:hypothetical protein
MPVHMDEAVFLVIGGRVVEGASLYSEISDIKLPGIFFLSYMLSVVFENSLLPARILGLYCQSWFCLTGFFYRP